MNLAGERVFPKAAEGPLQYLPVSGSGGGHGELSPGPGQWRCPRLPRRAPSAPALPMAAIERLHFPQINLESTKIPLLAIGLG